MDDSHSEVEERVTGYDERLSSEDEDPSPSTNATPKHTMADHDERDTICDSFAPRDVIAGLIYGPDGVPDLYTYPPSDWSRDEPLGPKATDMNKESPFMRLPLDIRLIIYEYIFHGFTLSLLDMGNIAKCVYTPPSVMRSEHFGGRSLKAAMERAAKTPDRVDRDQLPNRLPHMICRVSTQIREEAVRALASCTKVLICPELPGMGARSAEMPTARNGFSDRVITVYADEILNPRFRHAIKGLCVSMRSLLIAEYSSFPNLQKVSIDGYLDVRAALGWDDPTDDEAGEDEENAGTDSSDDGMVPSDVEFGGEDTDMHDASAGNDNGHESPVSIDGNSGPWQSSSLFSSPTTGLAEIVAAAFSRANDTSAPNDGVTTSTSEQLPSSPTPIPSATPWNADSVEQGEGDATYSQSQPTSSHHEFASSPAPLTTTAGSSTSAIAFDLAMANADEYLDLHASGQAPSADASFPSEPSPTTSDRQAENPPSTPLFAPLLLSEYFGVGPEFMSAISATFDPPSTPPASFGTMQPLTPTATSAALFANTHAETRRRNQERRRARAEARKAAREATRRARHRAALEATVLSETQECWDVRQTHARPVKIHPAWARRWWFELVWVPKYRREKLPAPEQCWMSDVRNVMKALKLWEEGPFRLRDLMEIEHPPPSLARASMHDFAETGSSSGSGASLMATVAAPVAQPQHSPNDDDDSGIDMPANDDAQAGFSAIDTPSIGSIIATAYTGPSTSSHTPSTLTSSTNYSGPSISPLFGTANPGDSSSSHATETTTSESPSTSQAKGKAPAQPTQSSTIKGKGKATQPKRPRPALAVQQAFKLDRYHRGNSYLVATVNLTDPRLEHGRTGSVALAAVDVRPPAWLCDLPLRPNYNEGNAAAGGDDGGEDGEGVIEFTGPEMPGRLWELDEELF